MRDLFWKIWQERDHYSFVSGTFLGHEPLSYFFSHILSRGAHPEAASDPENIVFMTLREHTLWEFERHKVRDLPEWDRVFKLRDSLLEKYSKKI